MQQQQGARDRIAVMQQMAGSSDFQPPRRAVAAGPEQMGEGHDEATREAGGRTGRSSAKAGIKAESERAATARADKPRS